MGHLISDVRLTHSEDVDRAANAAVPAGIEHYAGLPAYELLRHAAAKLPQRTAICYGQRRWSYERANYDAVRCAAMFQRLGLRRGDRVGILLPNVPEFIIATNGVWRAGGIVVALSPLMPAAEVRRMIELTGCRFVVCLDMLSQLVSADQASPRNQLADSGGDARQHARLLGDTHQDNGDGYRSNGDGHGRHDAPPANAGAAVGATPHAVEMTLLVSIREHLPALQQLGYLWMRHHNTGHWSLPSGPGVSWFWEQVDQTQREFDPVAIDPRRDPAYILPTGGTTAQAKAVTLSHQNLVANAWQQYVWTGRSFGNETMLAVLPFFHSYGLSATVLGGAAMAATLVLHHRFNTRQVIRMIEQHRPTVFHAVPAMLTALDARLRTHRADLSSLRWVISGGAPLDREVAEEFVRHSGALVVEGYGLSEASPVTHVGPLFQPPRYGTIGLCLPETQSKIVATGSGETDQATLVEVPQGEVGELLVRGPQVMLGYWRDAAATAEAVRDGWLHTGDLATVDGDGFFTIVGRKKDLIITSGFNVYPAEVEEVLCRVPGVAGAAVVGQPDVRCGEIVKAFVQLQPGAKWDEALLRRACSEQLSKHKCPRIYERCEGELPRNFLGKLIRRHLRTPQETTASSSPLVHPTPVTVAAGQSGSDDYGERT